MNNPEKTQIIKRILDDMNGQVSCVEACLALVSVNWNEEKAKEILNKNKGLSKD